MACCERCACPPRVAVLLVAGLMLGAGGVFFTVPYVVSYLTRAHGLTYSDAALAYGLYGLLSLVAGMVASPALDHVPLAALLPATLLGAGLARLVFATRAPLPWAVAALMLSGGLEAQWLTAGLLALKRQLGHWARATQRSPVETEARAMGLLYALQNVMAVLSGVALTGAAAAAPADTSAPAEAYRLVLAAGGALSVAGAAVLALAHDALAADDARRGHDAVVMEALVAAANDDNDDDDDALSLPPAWTRRGLAWRQSRHGGVALAGRAVLACARWHHPALWRFLAVCSLVLPVRMLFRHLETTLPEVLQRLHGPDVPYALVQAVNPLLIIPLGPLVQHATAAWRAYTVLAVGTTVSAASVLALVAAGPAAAVGSLWPYVAFVALFSVGEALWSPRFVTYALQAAPPRREATFVAVAGLPALAAKLPTVWFSAWVVEAYCPAAHATCDAWALWAWVASVSAVTPIGLWVGKWFLDA